MSTLVKSNDLLVFGPQSPFYRVITEAGLKEMFLRLLIDKSSKVVRKRSFQAYLLATKIFPNNTLNINEGIRFGINQFLLPFTRFGIRNSMDSIINMKTSSYIQGEIALTNEIAKATKIKDTLVMISDSEKTTFSNQKGITTYITRKFSESEGKDLDASWSNGFFTFTGLNSLSILIIIPKQYLANLMINISSQDFGKNSTGIENSVALLDALKTEMIIDLIKSFFAAIYSDGYKHRINTDIATLNTIFKEEGANILTSANDEEAVYNDILNKYRQTLRGFKENDCENIIFECMKLYQYRNHIIINPYEFYSSFIDLPYSHIKMVFDKISILKIFSSKSVQSQISEPDFSNNLSSMSSFFDDDRAAIIYGLKLVKFLPFFIFNTYIVGGGNYHAQMLMILNHVESFIGTINSFKNTNNIYGPICNFIIEELNYMVFTLAKQMNSPLNVNNNSRHMVVNLISNSSINLDE